MTQLSTCCLDGGNQPDASILRNGSGIVLKATPYFDNLRWRVQCYTGNRRGVTSQRRRRGVLGDVGDGGYGIAESLRKKVVGP